MNRPNRSDPKTLALVFLKAATEIFPVIEVSEPVWQEKGTWDRKMGKQRLASIRRMETRIGTPLGPNGHWALAWTKKFGRYYRPHKTSEIILEFACPIWDQGRNDMLSLISSGPFGGLYTVFLNHESLLMNSDKIPFDSSATAVSWLKNHNYISRGNA